MDDRGISRLRSRAGKNQEAQRLRPLGSSPLRMGFSISPPDTLDGLMQADTCHSLTLLVHFMMAFFTIFANSGAKEDMSSYLT